MNLDLIWRRLIRSPKRNLHRIKSLKFREKTNQDQILKNSQNQD